jgi:predicted transposase/invertase (TIGR01784 family)
MREMALSDYTSGINYARREGRREGWQEGRREGRQEGWQGGRQEGILEIARKLKSIGDSVEKIIKATGLSEEEINKL